MCSLWACGCDPMHVCVCVCVCARVCVCFTMLNMNKCIISLMYFDATGFGVRIYALHVFL